MQVLTGVNKCVGLMCSPRGGHSGIKNSDNNSLLKQLYCVMWLRACKAHFFSYSCWREQKLGDVLSSLIDPQIYQGTCLYEIKKWSHNTLADDAFTHKGRTHVSN